MKETRSQITQPTMAAKAMTADMDALEDITNKRKEKKQMTFEDIKKLVKNSPPPPPRSSSNSFSKSQQPENVELIYIESSDPKGGRRREVVKRIRATRSTNNDNNDYDSMNSNIDEINQIRESFRANIPTTPPPLPYLSPSSSSSSPSSQPPLDGNSDATAASDVLASLILLDKNEMLREVAGVRVIEYIPKKELTRYKKLAAAEYVKRVKEIVDNDIVKSERFENIIIEAEKLEYREIAELLRRIKEQEESNCFVDPLLFVKRFFCIV